jgi:hypothetical protein
VTGLDGARTWEQIQGIQEGHMQSAQLALPKSGHIVAGLHQQTIVSLSLAMKTLEQWTW